MIVVKNQVYTLVASMLLGYSAYAQSPATTAAMVQNGIQQKENLAKTSIVNKVPFVNIGPTVMSGRVVDLEVNPQDPTEFYVGYASGGLWYTNNNGTSFTPILDNAPTQNVGDIAVDWKTKTIWVGTGENNSSRSSYAGIGILKSRDQGKTWEHVGLPDSHHIGQILINPQNPDEVVVGVIGHLYSPNEERGIYKTTDGGKTWKKTLFINNETGIIEIVHAPNNYNVMFAASWQRDRKAWHFEGSGEGSAVYKSTDAGVTWTKISSPDSGLPTGKGVGRIGLTVFSENEVYILHDSQFRRKAEDKKKKASGLTKENFKTMTKADFLALENKKLNVYLKQHGFHEKYRAENVKQLIKSGSVTPADLAKYLENANAIVHDTPVIGAEVYKTTDGGKTWKKTHKQYIENMYSSYGYYFGEIRVDATKSNTIYLLGVSILKSDDGGKTFESIGKENVHADHQALWVNPKRSGHLINGNDGGVNITYDDGAHWSKANEPSVGQFYYINIDHQKPYNVYGGLQDNGVWVGPHTNKESRAWESTGHYPYESLMGGDGMQIQIDRRNPDIVYTGFQFGNYFRINRATGEQTYIQPKHELGDTPYRFNWQTPILLSSHNQDILYYGGNKLMRSMNKGDNWTVISPDLTNGGKKGNVAYGTLTTIAESPMQFGLIYTGSDDGVVQLTKNSGGDWTKISTTFPKDLWVSRVVASQHKKERVYVTLNGYRWDDFTPYVYVSDDYGTTWKSLSKGLPTSPVNVIKEDPSNENVLYLGTDNGVYVSFDKGVKWELFKEGIPNVAVHDLVIQPEAKDLLIGTHGRSIYKTNIASLQEYDAKEGLQSFKINPVKWSPRWGSSWSVWRPAFESKTTVSFYAPKTDKVTIAFQIEDTVFKKETIEAVTGFNYWDYDLSITEKEKKQLLKALPEEKIEKKTNEKYYLPTGKYTVIITQGNQKVTTTLEVK